MWRARRVRLNSSVHPLSTSVQRIQIAGSRVLGAAGRGARDPSCGRLRLHMSSMSPRWVRSSYCSDTTCVEIAELGDEILLRDGKRIDQAPIQFTHAEWADFLDGIVAGRIPGSLRG